MLPKTPQEVSTETGEICKFYAGKTILITGAAGFLGSVLLEILLRCCPGISRIYIILRSKKGVLAEERKNLIFKKEIFFKLKETNPDVFVKVIPISGDTSLDNLGLNDNDYNALIKNVSIVFHVAATISFTKPLSFTVQQNVISTINMLDLCRKLNKLEAFVYTSSAYSNSNQKDVIEEKIYDLPFPAEEVVKFGRENNDDELMRLFRLCSPPHPNFYTFSKCVSENLLKEKAHDLPVCIIRPSIIIYCLKGPLPGYVEDGSAIINISTAVGRGLVRVMRMDGKKGLEIIPVDVTAKALIVGAFRQSSKILPSPYVYNCVTSEQCAMTWDSYMESMISMVRRNPLPYSYIYPVLILCKRSITYNLLSLLLHYMPAIVIDFFLWISGSKFNVLRLYTFYEKSMKGIEYFVLNDWNMRNENFLSLSESLYGKEKEIFSMDLKDFTLDSLAKSIPTGAPPYRINGKLYEETLYWKCLRYFLTFVFVSLLLGIIALLLYLAFSLMDMVLKIYDGIIKII